MLHVRQFAGSRSSGLRAARHDGEKNLRHGRSFAGDGRSLSRCGFRQAGVRVRGIWGTASRWKLADDAWRGQPTGRCGGENQRCHYFGTRYYGRTKTGTAGGAERAAGGDGRNDWGGRPRTEQPSDQHHGRESVRTLPLLPPPPARGRSGIMWVGVGERPLNLQAYSRRKNNFTVAFLKE